MLRKWNYIHQLIVFRFSTSSQLVCCCRASVPNMASTATMATDPRDTIPNCEGHPQHSPNSHSVCLCIVDSHVYPLLQFIGNFSSFYGWLCAGTRFYFFSKIAPETGRVLMIFLIFNLCARILLSCKDGYFTLMYRLFRLHRFIRSNNHAMLLFTRSYCKF